MARRVRELAEKARELKLTDDVAVVFANKNLETAVRETLEMRQGPLTRGHLKRMKELVVEEPVDNLTGLEHAVNLTKLYLRDNQISDVSPLASLTNLTTIRLSMSRSPQVGGVGMLIDGWLTSVTRRTMSTFRILADAA